MGETNYAIKDLLRQFLGNHQLVFSCGDVAKDHAVTELNVFEVKAGGGCFVGGDFFQGSLVESHLAIVDGAEGDSTDVGLRELVGDYFFSADVMHVCGKLADDGQLSGESDAKKSAAGGCPKPEKTWQQGKLTHFQ